MSHHPVLEAEKKKINSVAMVHVWAHPSSPLPSLSVLSQQDAFPQGAFSLSVLTVAAQRRMQSQH